MSEFVARIQRYDRAALEDLWLLARTVGTIDPKAADRARLIEAELFSRQSLAA